MSEIAVTGKSGTIGKSIKKETISIDRSILNDYWALSNLFRINKVKSVLHLASPTQTFEKGYLNQDFEFGIYQTTLKLFEAFAKSGGKKFGYVSSAHVYGKKEIGHQLKEDDECMPISDYAKWKFETELNLKKRAERFGIQVLVMRPFSIFGKGMRTHFLAGRLERESNLGDFSSISFSLDYRDFSTPSEIAEKVIRLMEVNWEENYRVLNVCTGVKQTVKERVLLEYPNIPVDKFMLKRSALPFLVGDTTYLQKFIGAS
jgi:nucleoside-diphosphate-sugar epimerase